MCSLEFVLFLVVNRRMLDLSPVVRRALSFIAVFDDSFLKPLLIICRSLTARLAMAFLVGYNDAVDFFGFVAEVDAFESNELFKKLVLWYFAGLLSLFNTSLRIFSPLAEDSSLPAFLKFAVEGRLSLGNLSLRFNCAADFCTRSLLPELPEITGNVKRDGKRIDEDESRDKSRHLTLDVLLGARGTKCRSSACSFSISSRRTMISSMLSSAISGVSVTRRLHLEYYYYFFVGYVIGFWKFSL